MKKSAGTKIFELVVGTILIILCFLMIYPFIYALAYSLSNGQKVMFNPVTFYPVGLNLQNYKAIFEDSRIAPAILITIYRTITGTLLFLVVTGSCAYALSKKRLIGRKFFYIFFIVPMYMNGGMIPTYLLIRDLHLLDNILVYILPGCFATFYMLLIRSYMDTIPESIEESAKMDGAGDMNVFIRIYIPMCIPIIATIIVFVGVGQWNAWYDAVLYMTKTKLFPMQLILQIILKSTDISNLMDPQAFHDETSKANIVSPQTFQMAMVMLTVLPIIFIYPFFQRYFIKGISLGGVKG